MKPSVSRFLPPGLLAPLPIPLWLGKRRRRLPVSRGQVDDHQPAREDLLVALVAPLGGVVRERSGLHGRIPSTALSARRLRSRAERPLWTARA